MGMPGQDLEEVEASIRFAHEQGAKISIAEYSPIPGTKDWESIKNTLPTMDPLWQNNSVYPLLGNSNRIKIQELKNLANILNSSYR
jgi:radical SAM superfamily enzyme YgiQ (UPF0313 family)